MKKIILIAITCLLCSFQPIESFLKTDQNFVFATNKQTPLCWENQSISKKGSKFFLNNKTINVGNDLYIEFIYDYSRFTILSGGDLLEFYREMHSPYKWLLLDIGDHYVLVLNGEKTHNYTVKK